MTCGYQETDAFNRFAQKKLPSLEGLEHCKKIRRLARPDTESGNVCL